MDYMYSEQKRGITINAACIQFKWENTKINLIDTPGHIDFFYEVRRSLKVLEGALVIIDALRGVQSQTERVWGQAEYLQKIVVVNKLDEPNADFDAGIESVSQSFKVGLFRGSYWEDGVVIDLVDC